jgi:hypothetical protein
MKRERSGSELSEGKSPSCSRESVHDSQIIEVAHYHHHREKIFFMTKNWVEGSESENKTKS